MRPIALLIAIRGVLKLSTDVLMESTVIPMPVWVQWLNPMRNLQESRPSVGEKLAVNSALFIATKFTDLVLHYSESQQWLLISNDLKSL